jgi:hypothetical protein
MNTETTNVTPHHRDSLDGVKFSVGNVRPSGNVWASDAIGSDAIGSDMIDHSCGAAAKLPADGLELVFGYAKVYPVVARASALCRRVHKHVRRLKGNQNVQSFVSS